MANTHFFPDEDPDLSVQVGEDGDVVIDLGKFRDKQDKDEEHYENLALEMDTSRLSGISQNLMDAIEADDRSRQASLETAVRALDLLGLELKRPRSTVADSSAPVEGMSSIYNPLLLEAILRGWAATVGELLPAEGPVKIYEAETPETSDDLADALERDMNHYLTHTATEYYPDTSHMLLWGTYFKGSGFKKIYRCPMRRRPVSESVDAKDLIVSDASKDLRSCSRITHQIQMRSSVMKRMMLLGAYRDVSLPPPTTPPGQVEQKVSQIQGVGNSWRERPEDQPFTIWECQCELDLDEYAPKGFKGEGIPLPYIVTMDKDSREILSLRRDWDPEDDQAQRDTLYIKYPYVPGPGFYGTGLLNILGNSSAAMTAAWREMLDAGQYANFPAFLISKQAGRQNTSDIRVPPGTGVPIETGGQPIGQMVMRLPYNDVTPGLMALVDKITTQAKAMGGAVDIPSSEGLQNVPVGTMLANLEQSTKVMNAAHKAMHQAQAEEIGLLIKLFKKNPEDFWRYNKVCPKGYWNEQKFLQALEDCNLIPASDPNVPSHLHRVMKAMALVQLQGTPLGQYMSPKEVLLRCLRALKEDPNGLVVDPPPQQPGEQVTQDKMIMAQAKMQDAQTKSRTADMKGAQLQFQARTEAQKQQTQRDVATTELAKELIVHQQDQARLDKQQQVDAQKQAHEMSMAERQHQMGVADTQQQMALKAQESQHDMQMSERQGQLDAQQAQQEHALDAQQADRQHELAQQQAKTQQKLATQKAKQPKPTGGKK